MYCDETACWIELQTHTAPHREEKKKPCPCQQTQPQLHPDVHADAAFAEAVKESRFQRETKARGNEWAKSKFFGMGMGVDYMGQRESKAGRF